MILVLADGSDIPAQHLVRRWSDHRARLMTSADLSLPGWRLELGRPSRWTAIVGGRPVADNEGLRAVVNRLRAVTADMLTHIVAEDRDYVAQEMTAFLFCWLTELACTVVNRPAPLCLNGPGWRQEQWLHQAAQLGIPTIPSRRPASRAAGERVTVTLAGTECIGAPDAATCEWLNRQVRRLAGAAQIRLGRFAFDMQGEDLLFAGADAGADLDNSAVCAALLAWIEAPERNGPAPWR